MALLSIRDLSFSYAGPPVLDHATVHIERGDKVCLFGRNGEGKSTLLRLVCRALPVESGAIDLQRGATIGWLQQDVPEGQDGSVADVVTAGLGDVSDKIAAYRKALADVADDPIEANLNRLDRAQTEMEAVGGWEIQERIEAVVSRLGLDADQAFSDLSGGWRRRAFLAAALVRAPDVLVLDEPTNHLDVEAIEWLEGELARYDGAVLFVTHDRAFLRAVATRIIELDRGHLVEYPADFDAYKARKAHDLEVEASHDAEFDRKLAIEEAWIRTGIKARRTRNEGRVRALKRLRDERKERRSRKGRARMQLQLGERSGREVVIADGVSFSYDEMPLVSGFDAIIARGDRIGLVGPNGIGKTTLLRLLLGELAPDTGTIELGTRLEVRYFDQLRNALDPKQTVAKTLVTDGDALDVGGKRKHVISYLRDFLFDDVQARQPVRLLSGGEKNRLLLAKLFASPANVLVLDEPTNDLDLDTLELLETLLLDYPGTVLLVSHDREFLDNVVTECFVFEGGGVITRVVGGYAEWDEIRAQQRAEEAAAARDAAAARRAAAPSSAPASNSLSRAERKELEGLPERIEALDANIERLREALADPELYRTHDPRAGELAQQLSETESALALAYERWEALEAKV